MAGLVGDRRLVLKRLETEAMMDLSTEFLNSRAVYFEALNSGDDVRHRFFLSPDFAARLSY